MFGVHRHIHESFTSGCACVLQCTVLYRVQQRCCSVTRSCPSLCDPKVCRLLCPSPSPAVCSNSCQLGGWCYPTILSSVVAFSSFPQSFPASGSFLMSQLFPSGSQSIGTSASASVLPMNIQGRFPLGLTGLISLQSKGLLRVFSSTTAGKPKLYSPQPFYGPTLTYIYDYRIKI